MPEVRIQNLTSSVRFGGDELNTVNPLRTESYSLCSWSEESSGRCGLLPSFYTVLLTRCGSTFLSAWIEFSKFSNFQKFEARSEVILQFFEKFSLWRSWSMQKLFIRVFAVKIMWMKWRYILIEFQYRNWRKLGHIFDGKFKLYWIFCILLNDIDLQKLFSPLCWTVKWKHQSLKQIS